MTPAELENLIAPMKARFAELENALGDPAIYSDPAKSGALMRERSSLEEFFALYHAWEQMLKEAQESRSLLETEEDPALRELAESELAGLEEKSAEDRKSGKQKTIKIKILPGSGTPSSPIRVPFSGAGSFFSEKRCLHTKPTAFFMKDGSG